MINEEVRLVRPDWHGKSASHDSNLLWNAITGRWQSEMPEPIPNSLVNDDLTVKKDKPALLYSRIEYSDWKPTSIELKDIDQLLSQITKQYPNLGIPDLPKERIDRRKRGQLYAEIGDKDWKPTSKDFTNIDQLLQQADIPTPVRMQLSAAGVSILERMKRSRKTRRLLGFALTTLAIIGLCAAAEAHDHWADGTPVPAEIQKDCCGVADAHHLKQDQVIATSEGYQILGDQHTKLPGQPPVEIKPGLIPYRYVKPSPDGEWWVFYSNEANEFSRQFIYCVFGPVNGA